MRFPDKVTFVYNPPSDKEAEAFGQRIKHALAILDIKANWGMIPIADHARRQEPRIEIPDGVVIGVGGKAISFLEKSGHEHMTMKPNPLPEDPAGFALHLAATLGRERLEGQKLRWKKADQKLTIPKSTDPLMGQAEDYLGALKLTARQIHQRFDPEWNPEAAANGKHLPWAEIIANDHAALRLEAEAVRKRGATIAGYGAKFDWRKQFPEMSNGKAPLPKLALASKDWLVYINAPGHDHGPGHVHAFARDLAHGVRGTRLVLVASAVKDPYSARYPYLREAKGEASEKGPLVVRQTNKYNIPLDEIREVQNLCDRHASTLIGAWQELYDKTPLAKTFVRDDLPGPDRISEYSYQGGMEATTRKSEAEPRTGGLRGTVARR